MYAERGVKLINDFSKILTKNEKKREWLLQGVESNRKKYSNDHKATLNKK